MLCALNFAHTRDMNHFARTQVQDAWRLGSRDFLAHLLIVRGVVQVAPSNFVAERKVPAVPKSLTDCLSESYKSHAQHTHTHAHTHTAAAKLPTAVTSVMSGTGVSTVGKCRRTDSVERSMCRCHSSSTSLLGVNQASLPSPASILGRRHTPGLRHTPSHEGIMACSGYERDHPTAPLFPGPSSQSAATPLTSSG